MNLPSPTPRPSRHNLPDLLTALVLLLGPLACGGGGGGGGAATAQPVPVVVASITPLSGNVVVGQTLQYTASAPSGTKVTWTVSPAAGGTISASGLFTAGTVQGSYTVTGAWAQANGPAVSASTSVFVVPAPQAALLNPNTVPANGGAQTSANGLTNLTVIGEDLGLQTSTSTSGSLQNRPGLDPTATPSGQ